MNPQSQQLLQGAPTSLTPYSCFTWGLFGSALPEVLRLYKIAVGGQAEPTLHWYYAAMSIVFAICAGIFTVAWKPENSFKAIWVGVSSRS